MLKIHALLLLIAVFISGTASSQPIPLEAIGRLPVFSDPSVSPNGRYTATRLTVRGKPVVVVQPILEPGKSAAEPVYIAVDDRQLSWFSWANDDYLVVGVRDTIGFRGQLRNLERMASINREGTEARFFKMQPNDFGFYRQYAYVQNWMKNDPDHILAVLDDEPNEWAVPQVHKVNLKTGERSIAARNRKNFLNWVSDADGNLRIGVKFGLTRKNSNVEIHYRENRDSSWELLQEIDYYDADRLFPYAFDEDDPNILLLSTRRDINDFDFDEDLHRYDLTAKKFVGQHKDEEIQRVRQLVEKALPEHEIDIVSLNKDRTVGFIRHHSDVLSPEYYLLDLNKGKLQFVAAEYPELVNYELAPMLEREVTARDGLMIPVLLTLPTDAKDEPVAAVVMPHGGPWAHDEWGFDNYVQFLASRGYAVIQPQFRGSTGFGLEHEEAGYGQWGKAIQDDITDVTRWAIEEGLVDPERICIFGSSFGGYAAAMGAIKEPELYACAVSVNGVLDLDKYIYDGKQLLFENVNKKVWNNPSEAKSYSPYHRAKEIKAPLLIVASERDTVVPAKHHSKRMHKRLKKLKKAVEYIELPDGEHWRTNEANELLKLGAIEKFLARHLSPGTQ